MKEVKIYYKDGKEVTEDVFSRGFAYYEECPICHWKTQKYFENSIHGLVPCEQCGRPVFLSYFQNIHPEDSWMLKC